MTGINKQKKWALITGASAGIGAAFAKQIAAEGYDVFLVARRKDRLQDLCQSIAQETGRTPRMLAADLSDFVQVKGLLAQLSDENISIDLLFNNAGYGTNGEFCDLEIGRELRMIDLNCRALVALSHAIAGPMRERGRGVIIHTASVGGLSPTPYFATYGATKAFIVAFSEALSEELRSHGVKVIALCPGVTDSEFAAAAGFGGKMPPKYVIESAEQVAATAIKAIAKNRTLVVSGRHNRLAVLLSHCLPRRLSLRFAAKAMQQIPSVESARSKPTVNLDRTNREGGFD